MPTARELLEYLHELGVTISEHDGKLVLDAPTGAVTGELAAELAATKPEIVKYLRAERRRHFERLHELAVEGRAEPPPLSFAQERLWFLEQLGLVGAAYNISTAYRLHGPLSVDTLERSFAALVRRHQTLRTRFLVERGNPLQAIDAAPDEFELPMIEVPAADRETQLRGLVRAEAERPFDLSAAHGFRASLLRLSSDEHVLLLTMHHIVSDGWSLGVLLRDLGALYRAELEQRATDLPPLPVQYADYTVWQRESLNGDAMAGQRRYWSERLAGVELLVLPSDYVRPGVTSFRGSAVRFCVPEELVVRMRRICHEETATLFMFLLTAFQVVLARWSGQRDIVIGSPTAGRSHPDTEGLIGFFVNTLALRAGVSGTSSFRTLLRQAKEVTLEAYAHQDVPFEQIVADLQPQRDLSRQPLFQVMLVLQAFPEGMTTWLPGLRIEAITADVVTSKFDLTMNLYESGDRLLGVLEYATDLYAASTVDRMVAHFLRLLDLACTTPDLPVGVLDLRSDAERALLDGLNRTAAPLPAVGVHESVEQAVERTPERLAVVFPAIDGGEDRTLTFRELNARANRLAHYLRTRGVSPEARVAICLERCTEMAVAVLAVLKAGGVCVPLDPAYPRQRLALMLEDAAAHTVVVHAATRDRIPEPAAGRVVCLDRDAAMVAKCDDANPMSGIAPDNLVYVIFTSGSTGRAKGVSFTHRALTNLIEWNLRTLAEGDAVLQFASLSFDASFHELFAAWTSGRRVVMVPDGWRADPAKMFDYLRRWPVQTVILPVAVLRQWSEHWYRDPDALAALAQVVTTGEQLVISPSTTALFEQHPDWRLHNHYGPSETHVVTAYTLEGPPGTWPRHPPIGRPISNVEVYVLDEFLHPALLSVVGELYIGGAAVARGYIGRPALTAERFVANPLGAPGSRLYRTGDLVRCRADGALEFLGRADDQIKIRGHRVELADVEAALLRQPGVRAAVVVARTDAMEDTRLAAYVVADHLALDEPALRERLQRELPEHMQPSSITALPQLPLTVNGKVDRRRLPAPEPSSRMPTFAAPSSSTEIRMAGIWSSVLRVERVGVDDDFFRLGGHSLLATRLLARIGDEFSVTLALRTLFDAPTVRTLSLALDRVLVADGSAATVSPLVPDETMRHEPFPLTQVQQAYWLGRGDSFVLGNVAAYGYQELDYADIDIPRLEAAWQRLIERHDMLRMVVRSDGQQQVLANPPAYQILVHDLREATETARAAALEETRARLVSQVLPADRWPLFVIEASLLPGRIRVHFGIDALVADAGSLDLLFREWEACYDDPEAPLAPLEVTFRDYVLAERKLHDTPAYEEAWAYWRSRAPALPEGPALPLAAVPEQMSGPRFAQVFGAINVETWERIKARAAVLRLTPTAVLVAAYADALTLYSGQSHFTLNLTVFNRLPLHPDVEHIIGDFTSLLPLEIDGRCGDSFDRRVARIQHQLVDDLDRRLVSGVQVLRERARQLGGRSGGTWPVVFTSTLGTMADGRRERAGVSKLAAASTSFRLSQTPQVWVDFCVGEGPGGLWYSCAYVEGLFPAGLIEGMVARVAEQLERLAAAETSWEEALWPQVSGLELAGRAQANATTVPLAQRRLEELFLAQVSSRRSSPAVMTKGRTLTYGELEARSRAVARWVQRQGVGRGALVAVVMEKGWEQVVAVVGVLRAGAAYVPLDAGWPAERVQRLLSATGSRCVLTQAAVEELGEAQPDETVAPLGGSAAELAYVIYTSGSTGMPKGVMVTHAAAVNTIVDVTRRVGVGPEDRVLGLSALHFDLSVYDVFGTLGAGGTLVLPATGEVAPDEWLTLMTSGGVTVWNSVPALLQLLVEEAQRRGTRLAELRVALLSGDWIPLKLPEQLRSMAPEAAILALGGATEAAIWSNVQDATTVDPTWPSVPYGRPLANQTFHVLNGALEPCPVWTPGELYIGGAGVALGYWGKAAQTATSFVPHPVTGERLYRTGDLGRYWPDGVLEFLGRRDTQVKIGGHRIELGEIEAVLHGQAGVRQAVVAAVGPARARHGLVAYVVAHDASTPLEGAALRAALEAQLPAYMVPRQIVFIPALPLTANGKVNHAALPALEAPAAAAPNYVAPRTFHEQTLCALASEVMQIEHVGIDDDFFELGAHSLHAARFVARIHDVLGQRVPIRTLFECRTVRRLAACLHEPETTEGVLDTVLALRSRGTLVPLVCLPPATGLGWLYAGLLPALDPNRPLYCLQAPAIREDRPLPVSVESLACELLAELPAMRAEGPYCLVGWSLGGLLAYVTACRLQSEGHDVPLLVIMDAYPLAATGVDGVPRELTAFDKAEAHRLGDDWAREWAPDGFPLDVTRGEAARIRRFFDHALALEPVVPAGGYEGDLLLFTAAGHSEWARLWQPYVSGRVSVITMPGTHTEMIHPASIRLIGRAIEDHLARCNRTADAAAETARRGGTHEIRS